jgi:hypothetical protein
MKGKSGMCSPSAGANWSGRILEANRDSDESVCSAVQQCSGSPLALGRGGGQASRRRVPRRGTILLRKRSWPANRATLHSALAHAMMALCESTSEARRWMGKQQRVVGGGLCSKACEGARALGFIGRQEAARERWKRQAHLWAAAIDDHGDRSRFCKKIEGVRSSGCRRPGDTGAGRAP